MKNLNEIVERIKQHYPNPKIEIDFDNPFELLVGVVLSARCTDKLTNKITKELFSKMPTVQDMANAEIDSINKLISSCSMHNTKAKNLKKIAQILCEKYNCSVPNNFKALIELPGVADKTANIVLSFGFGVPAVSVDTHVQRTANRIGISQSKKPKDIENDIKNGVKKDDWIMFYSGLILLGRHICKARKPMCNDCFLNDICEKNGVE
jgi:endonuclease-3